MESTEGPLRVIIPVQYLLATKRKSVIHGDKLPNGDVILTESKEQYWWSLTFADGSTMSFCTDELAPPNYKPKVQLVIELEPADAQPEGPPLP